MNESFGIVNGDEGRYEGGRMIGSGVACGMEMIQLGGILNR